jgi:hypothetical protein
MSLSKRGLDRRYIPNNVRWRCFLKAAGRRSRIDALGLTARTEQTRPLGQKAQPQQPCAQLTRYQLLRGTRPERRKSINLNLRSRALRALHAQPQRHLDRECSNKSRSIIWLGLHRT